MQKLQILRQILQHTGADRLLTGFLCFTLFSALGIQILEPEIRTYGDALWYCYAVITTIGFGDVVAQHPLARVLSVVLSIYAALVIAIITGVVVNYYNQIVDLRQRDSLANVLDRLERLPELSREELEELAGQVRRRQRLRNIDGLKK